MNAYDEAIFFLLVMIVIGLIFDIFFRYLEKFKKMGERKERRYVIWTKRKLRRR